MELIRELQEKLDNDYQQLKKSFKDYSETVEKLKARYHFDTKFLQAVMQLALDVTRGEKDLGNLIPHYLKQCSPYPMGLEVTLHFVNELNKLLLVGDFAPTHTYKDMDFEEYNKMLGLEPDVYVQKDGEWYENTEVKGFRFENQEVPVITGFSGLTKRIEIVTIKTL